MFYIVRNNHQFGPYDLDRLTALVQKGNVILQDEVIDTKMPLPVNGCVRDVFRHYGVHASVSTSRSFSPFSRLGLEIFFSKRTFSWQMIKQDKQFLLLAFVGLSPLVLMPFSEIFPDKFSFYLISLYFSSIWALFFYYFFKTSQVVRKTTIKLFFTVQVVMMVLWGLGLNQLNPFYASLNSSNFFVRAVSYVCGVGFTEEFAKALPLFFIAHYSRRPLIPQTLVFYGLMCGISFGVFEGVDYQTTVNHEMDLNGLYGAAFFANIARLTSLPFFHAVCTGIAGYFISFAHLYPRFRNYLLVAAIAIPGMSHGFYDVLCGVSHIGAVAMAVLVVLLLNYYIRNDKYVQHQLSDFDA